MNRERSVRVPTRQEYCHENLGLDGFSAGLSLYDTERRVETLIDRFLDDRMLLGKEVLDVGCGLGFFSKRLSDRGAKVFACDIGSGLVEATRERVGCDGAVVDALRLVDAFGKQRFDGVVSSECIEHTPDPCRAIEEMVQVVRPGGFVSLSTPNILWSPVVKLSTRLGMRPFCGHENFSSWGAIEASLASGGATVVRKEGLHLFPFQLPLYRLSRWCDRHLQVLRGLMINLCVLARVS